MKKSVLALAFVAALASTDALASRARLLVHGAGDGGIGLFTAGEGSLYINDTYNMFHNPSYAAGDKDWATIDMKSNNNAAGSMGGFMTTVAGFNLGAFLNRTLSDNAAPQRPFEIIFAGDTGLKWGIAFGMSSQKEILATEEKSNSEMRIAAGVQVAGFEPWVNMLLSSNDFTSATEEDKYTDMSFGVKYRMGEWTPFAAYRAKKFTDASVVSGTGFETKTNYLGFGIGRTMKAGEATSVNYSIGYFTKSVDDGDATAGSTNKNVTNMIPLEVSAETDATSWLALRAGLSYTLMNQNHAKTTDKFTTVTAAPAASIGATFKFGPANWDFVLGSSTTTDAAANWQNTNPGIGAGLFTASSLTVKW